MNMLSPILPILILLAGAIPAVIGANWRFRRTPAIQAVSATLAIIALALIGRALPQTTAILLWRPVSLFGTPIVLGIDSYAWALGLALLVPVLAFSLRELANPCDSPLYPALLLAMSAIMLGTIGAANLLTLVLAWGLLDVVYCFALLTRKGMAGSRRAELVMGINGIATLLVWAALVFLEQDKLSSYWRLMTLPPAAQILLGAAVLLRVGLYPLYAWSTTNATSAPGETAALGETASIANLAPMMAGLALWVRLAAIQALPTEPWWGWVALALAVMAGLLAWVQTEARQSIAYVAIGYAGLLIAAGSLGLTAAQLTQGAVTWFLGIYALTHSYSFTGPRSKFNFLNWLWRLPALIAIAALFGLPATIGANYRAALHIKLAQARWAWWSLAVLVEALLAIAALRYAFAPQSTPAPAERAPAVILKSLVLPIAGLVVITLPLVIFGLWPTVLFAQPGAALGQLAGGRGWAGWLLPWIGALVTLVILGLKAWGKKLADQHWLTYAAYGRRIVGQALDTTWLYDLLLNSLRRMARLIGSLATLTEGKGALVWMILFIVLALLYLNEPGK